jgi:hypothetical protein
MMSVVGPSASNPTTKKGILVLRLSSNSPASLCRCDRPLRGRQLAPHHRVQLWATSLYRVSKDFVRYAAIQRHSWSMVGFLQCHPT